MATTCKLIAKNTLGSNAATITLSSIPGTGYTDLMVLISARTDRANANSDLLINLNGSSSNFSSRLLLGNGSSASSTTSSVYLGTVSGNNATSNTFGSVEVYIPNYAGSANKSYSVTSVSETNATTAVIAAVAGLWSNTAAITSITIGTSDATNLLTGSAVYLYGILKA